MKPIPFYRTALLLVCLVTGPSGDLTIEVTQGVDNAVRVAVVPFAWRGEGGLPTDVAEVIDSDLTLSGRFDTLPVDQMLSLPNTSDDVFFRDWRLLDVEYLVIGYPEPAPEYRGRIRLTFELYNVFQQQPVIGHSIEGDVENLRDMAHHVSDRVYEELTGIPGHFSTQIMYVTSIDEGRSAVGEPDGNRIRTFRLNVADADGRRVETVLESDEPILSATWAPDGRRIAYVSFQREGRPGVYIRDLETGRVELVAAYRGSLNGAPAFSPDGSKLALVLSKDGSPDIYVLDLDTWRLRRITRHYAIDTEPAWTPDGEKLIFTSNRGGQPQIYMMTLADLTIERLTFEGDYNARASMLPDGSAIVMVHRREGTFHIAMLDLERGRVSVLTETSLDESPSIAPNGSMVIYATQTGGEGILAAVSVDGGVKFKLPSSEGDVREPAWSPKKRMEFEPLSR
ncbi:MAG: Tol-Pal system beta propeller repeat protein TolB [Gammaproteobacteria bacterium]|nr:Tol-Pal system beta propeller repeat protein TolB [Gammaproteobacteria bacterium]